MNAKISKLLLSVVMLVLLILAVLWHSDNIYADLNPSSASHGVLSYDISIKTMTAQSPICGTPISVGGTIISDTIWSASNLYILDSDVTVSDGITLTIQPGVVIKGRDNTRLLVDGKLSAGGTITNPVHFTSWQDDTLCGDTNNDGTATLPAAGDWGWIEFGATSDPSSAIRRAVIRYGGERYGVGWRGAIRLIGVSPTLENITFEGNYRNVAEINPQNWTTTTWDSATVIYWLRGDPVVLPSETLTIPPGVKIKATNDAQLFVDGKLMVDGTQNAPTIFTSEKDDTICGVGADDEPICDTNNDGTTSLPAAGDWGWIEFGATSDPSSVIRRTVIRYGGERYGAGWRGAIRLMGISPTLENITFEGNYRNAAEINPQNWTTTAWDSSSVVYWLRGDPVVLPSETLTIPPGVKIKGTNNARLFVDGRLAANGIQEAPITFTSEKDDTVCGVGAADELICDTNNDGTLSLPAAGDWGWIEFGATGDPSSVIRRAVIRYGGKRDNVGWLGAIRLLNVSPTLENITFEGNYRNAAEISPENWTSTTWDSTTVVYWLRDYTVILPSEVLTIPSGVSIKATNNARFFVNGSLVANGTQVDPITFTSEKDDTVCGVGAADEPICDTNNDGTLSLPAAGNWGWIEFGATSDPTSVIRRAVIRYGGKRDNVGWLGAIRLLNVSPTLENITFEGNYRNAAEISPENWTTTAWNSTTVVYWLRGDTTILPSEVLTIPSGVSIKATNNSRLFVNGRLVANGTQVDPITFTSEKDDTVCGVGAADESICDTNNDGTLSLPAAGDWRYITFTNPDDHSVLEYVVVRYGGSGGYMVLSNGADLTVQNALLEHSSSDGLYIYHESDDPAVTVQYSLFRLNSGSGIQVAGP